MHPAALYTNFKGLHYCFFLSHCLDLDWLSKISTLLLACGSVWKKTALCTEEFAYFKAHYPNKV